MIDLLLARADVVMSARPSSKYCREQGIDWDMTRAHAGGLNLVPMRADRFRVQEGGRICAAIEAFDVDAETVLDVIAWPIDHPKAVLRAAPWMTPILGLHNLVNPATYFAGKPCRVFRTPLAWCQHGCSGIVILDAAHAAPWLECLPGRLAPEDQAHLDEIASTVPPLQSLPDFVLRRAA